MQLEIAFDEKVKEMALYKDQQHGDDHLSAKSRKTYLFIRRLTLVLFVFIVPYLQAPSWCL